MENIQLKKVGNSNGFVIPKNVLTTLGLTTGDKAFMKTEINATSRRLIIEVENKSEKLTIEELFKDYQQDDKVHEDLVDLGEPVGNEKW